ncbi:hypothetical protein [Streptomyces sp. NPDC059819]|uniref:hypothetical protein n=1 Tax=Streptomyces sp. NPDC059819 TaxID=3346963 RepID=UPI0036638B2D
MGIIPDRVQLDVYPGNPFGIFERSRVAFENFGDSPTHTEAEQVCLSQRAFALLARGFLYGDEARAVVRAELNALPTRPAPTARSASARGPLRPGPELEAEKFRLNDHLNQQRLAASLLGRKT